ncbi:MAG: D-glycerate dehydrogenase [Parcubacteria group bacterium GW2011_GWA2_38_13b]|nr:MAG: D-glycerate dehydrogenase [Parcubacteria group bacterium GW2011_GWA2_38_13b]
MFKIFVTRKIPDVGIQFLRGKKYDIAVSPYDRVLTRREIIKYAKGVDALLCLLTDKIDGEVMDGIGTRLKIIANYAVGVDNIDLEAAKKRGIIITNTPGVLTEAVAEHTIALLFAVTKRIAEADRFARAGKFKGWEPMLFLGSGITGKTLGIVGLGRIGGEVAKRMRDGFNVKIIYYDLTRNEEMEKALGIEYFSLETLLRTADFVSIHVPLLPSTKHLISEKELSLMKSSAYLINTSRGPVIDEKALVEALKKKIIRGAALDVFEFEPKFSPGLAKLNNVVLTPHIASATDETRGKMSELAAQNIIDVFSGGKPKNLVV